MAPTEMVAFAPRVGAVRELTAQNRQTGTELSLAPLGSRRRQSLQQRRGVFVDVDTVAAESVAASATHRGIQGRHTSPILCIQSGAAIDQDLHEVVPAPEGGSMDRRSRVEQETNGPARATKTTSNSRRI
jgi:hypothetical protein